ncbi:hypothetical protein ACFC09_31045 [Streptomyces sp. NPDC056161]|uniref:hypothetical protein n=1 Tax=Streptomyces sp. NPDC056161 TaxID=3345732 RepID=UPI0035DB4BD3
MIASVRCLDELVEQGDHPLVTLAAGPLVSLLGGISAAATGVGVVSYVIALAFVWSVGPETKGQPLPS